MAETLMASPESPDRAELLGALVRNAQRLETLVDELLTATGITTALPAGPEERVDLVEQIRTIWADTGSLEIDGTAVALVRRASVERVLAAVLDNALAYGKTPVSVRLKGTPGRVRVSVDSPGDVLSTEDVRFALQPFWRGERAVTTRPGLGLGLTVASVLARHEGGSLRVRARPGGGMITLIDMRAA
jgi:signal transduction histidine kinase